MIVVAGIPLLTLATLTIQHALNVTQLLSDLTRKAAGMERYWVPMWVAECGVQREGCISMVKHDDAQRALDAERHSKQCDMETLTLKFTSQLASLQARCAHLDVLLRDEYLPKLDVVAVQRSIADRDSRIDALEREVEKLDDDKETLQAQVKQLDRTLADVYQQRDGLQAQLRQLEGQSKQQAEEAVIVFAKYTTLRQLVEAFRSSEEWGAVKAWMVEGAPTWQEGVEAAKRITKAQYEMENALVGCRQALAAQDAGKEVASG